VTSQVFAVKRVGPLSRTWFWIWMGPFTFQTINFGISFIFPSWFLQARMLCKVLWAHRGHFCLSAEI